MSSSNRYHLIDKDGVFFETWSWRREIKPFVDVPVFDNRLRTNGIKLHDNRETLEDLHARTKYHRFVLTRMGAGVAFYCERWPKTDTLETGAE
jgi:hypothetical protein